MVDIFLARSAMLIDTEMWKGNTWLYEIFRIVTSSETIFFPEEDWIDIYNSIYSPNLAIEKMAARIRTFAPIDSPIINPAKKSELYALVRLAAVMSFCKVSSKDFYDVRFYNGDAFLPQGAQLEVVDSDTFIELIIMAMEIYDPKISVKIFDIIIEDTKVWFQTVLVPTSKLRTKALSRVLEKYGQVLGDDIIYWLVYKRFFLGELNCIKNIAIEVNNKIKEISQADPQGYMADIIMEEKFCKDIWNKLDGRLALEMI